MPTTLVTTKMKWNVDGEKSEEVVEGQIIKDLFLNILFKKKKVFVLLHWVLGAACGTVNLHSGMHDLFIFMWTFLQVFIEFATILFLCLLGGGNHKACGILAPLPRTKLGREVMNFVSILLSLRHL